LSLPTHTQPTLPPNFHPPFCVSFAIRAETLSLDNRAPSHFTMTFLSSRHSIFFFSPHFDSHSLHPTFPIWSCNFAKSSLLAVGSDSYRVDFPPHPPQPDSVGFAKIIFFVFLTNSVSSTPFYLSFFHAILSHSGPFDFFAFFFPLSPNSPPEYFPDWTCCKGIFDQTTQSACCQIAAMVSV